MVTFADCCDVMAASPKNCGPVVGFTDRGIDQGLNSAKVLKAH